MFNDLPQGQTHPEHDGKVNKPFMVDFGYKTQKCTELNSPIGGEVLSVEDEGTLGNIIRIRKNN